MTGDTQPVPSLPATFAEGRYRVTHQLGAGGMGLVVGARDELLGRDVAIKVLADNLAVDDAARERFQREARSAAAIHDARVVTVYDVGEQADRPYLVMELVDGPSLAEVLASQGPLPGDEVVDVAVDALAGLASAHASGVLHRDIKPANLLRAPDGTVKVTDFGVAVAADAEGLTRPGFVVGTAAYLAPERRRGQPGSAAADLWALGATLMELLTGHPPGDAASAEMDRLGDQVPGALRVLLARLVADDPADRPPSAVDALALLGGDPRAPILADAATPPPAPASGRREPTAVLPIAVPDAATFVPGDSSAPTEAFALTEPGGDRRGLRLTSEDPARWSKVAVVAVLLLGAGLAVQAVSGDREVPAEAETPVDEPAAGDPDPAFEVEVDPDDPAGGVRELARLLRERAGE